MLEEAEMIEQKVIAITGASSGLVAQQLFNSLNAEQA